MHMIPIFMQIQKLCRVVRVSIACAQILNDIFVPTAYTQTLDNRNCAKAYILIESCINIYTLIIIDEKFLISSNQKHHVHKTRIRWDVVGGRRRGHRVGGGRCQRMPPKPRIIGGRRWRMPETRWIGRGHRRRSHDRQSWLHHAWSPPPEPILTTMQTTDPCNSRLVRSPLLLQPPTPHVATATGDSHASHDCRCHRRQLCLTWPLPPKIATPRATAGATHSSCDSRRCRSLSSSCNRCRHVCLALPPPHAHTWCNRRRRKTYFVVALSAFIDDSCLLRWRGSTRRV
jgi:hypothetical protein